MHPAVRFSVGVTVALITATAPASASDWPQDGYDGGHSANNSLETLLAPRSVGGLRLAWRHRVDPAGHHGYEQFAGVTVVRNGRAFASWMADGSGSRLTALNVADGRALWHRRYPNADAMFVASTPDLAIANAGRGTVAFDAATGAVVWELASTRVSAASRTGSRLLVSFEGTTDELGVVSAADGSELWRRPLRATAEPLLSQRVVLLTTRTEAGPCLLGLDPAEGRTLWRRPVGGQAGLELASGGRAYVLTGVGPRAGLLQAFRASDGHRAWARSFDVPSFVEVPTAGDGLVFIDWLRCVSGCEGDAFGNHRGSLLALDVSSGGTVWHRHGGLGTGEPLWRANVVTPGLVYVHRFAGFDRVRVAALATEDGRQRWAASIGRGALGEVTAVADGRVFVGAASGYAAHPNVGGTVFSFALP